MFSIPKLAMRKSQIVTTVCNSKREVWKDYEEAKTHFLELMKLHVIMDTLFQTASFLWRYMLKQLFSIL